MRIRKGGAYRIVSEADYIKRYKPLGYVVVEEAKKKEPKQEINIGQYHKGGGWYEYGGNSYRKEELLEALKAGE